MSIINSSGMKRLKSFNVILTNIFSKMFSAAGRGDLLNIIHI